MLWAYRNTPHSATGEKPSYLLFGVDLRSPTEAAYLPSSPSPAVALEDYREELVVSLSSARNLAAEMIQKAQTRYKLYYDKQARGTQIRIGAWVLVHFPHEESGRNRKLSKPWHGPYRVISMNDTNLTCTKVYFPQHGELNVHQSRVCPCPPGFPAGYYWYGTKRKGPGRPPRWVDQLLTAGPTDPNNDVSTPTPTPSADDKVPKEIQSYPQEDKTTGVPGNGLRTPMEQVEDMTPAGDGLNTRDSGQDLADVEVQDLSEALETSSLQLESQGSRGHLEAEIGGTPIVVNDSDQTGRDPGREAAESPYQNHPQRNRRLRQTVRPPKPAILTDQRFQPEVRGRTFQGSGDSVADSHTMLSMLPIHYILTVLRIIQFSITHTIHCMWHACVHMNEMSFI